MSFKGTIEARCPNGCEAAPAEVWSFVRGDLDAALREALLAGELNMLVCLQCNGVFYPEATVVYCDVKAELVAFIFPESYRDEEAHWRAKMRSDYAAMRGALGGKLWLNDEPFLFFGMDPFRELLQEEDDLEDEVQIAQFLCSGLKLGLRPVQRAFARRNHLPWLLPCAGKGKLSRETALDGVRTLLNANDRLVGYRRWQDRLESGKEVPPVA